MTGISKEQAFWQWFKQNDEMLLHFERDRERIFGQLSAALAGVSPDLTFEFGPLQQGARDFVISAGGLRSAFPAVEALAAAAPALPRWNVVKFRPRRPPMSITYGGKAVRPEDVEFCVISNGKELGIYLFLKGYRGEEEKTWGQIGYLLLDQALGEYDVETKVGLIKFFSFDAHPDARRYPLAELPAIFDAHFEKLKH